MLSLPIIETRVNEVTDNLLPSIFFVSSFLFLSSIKVFHIHATVIVNWFTVVMDDTWQTQFHLLACLFDRVHATDGLRFTSICCRRFHRIPSLRRRIVAGGEGVKRTEGAGGTSRKHFIQQQDSSRTYSIGSTLRRKELVAVKLPVFFRVCFIVRLPDGRKTL